MSDRSSWALCVIARVSVLFIESDPHLLAEFDKAGSVVDAVARKYPDMWQAVRETCSPATAADIAIDCY